MTSSMLRRQLKNLVQNYSEAEVKVREATSNDPWGPSSSQMADISDLTYNVVACNEIMTMLWKRLKDDKNWRHIHKSLTLLEYLLKTGDDRVLLKMKDNIYIVKALTEYRFVEKDGKDQGVNVREKAKVVLVLMEDDEKLKEERDFAFKTREKTSKSSAASSADTMKDPNYKPCYVPGATGLPSLDNIPSVADLTASFTARKEERLRQEAEKKEIERRANLTEDELKWEDASKGGNVKDDAWGGQKSGEEEAKPDPWGAPKEPKEASGVPGGTPSSPDRSETPASSDPWGVPTNTKEDPFTAKTNEENPFTASKDQNNAFSTSKGDPFNAPKDNTDPFSAPKDMEAPFTANNKPDPFISANNDPFGAPKDDPFNTPKDDPFNTPKDDSFNTPKDDPFNTPKDDPFNTPKDDPFNTPKDDPFNTPKDDPFNTPKDDPFNTPKDDPFSAKTSTPPKDDPFNSSKDDPFNTPKDDPFTAPTTPPKEDPFSTPKDDPFTAPTTPPKEDPFSTPKDDPFTAPTTPPKEDPFSTSKDDPFTAPTTPPEEDPFFTPKDDPFTAPTTPPKEDPFTTPKDDPFIAPTTPPKEDPFTTPKDDPFTAPTPPPKDPFSVVSSPPKDDATDPFSDPPMSPPTGNTDAWGAPATSPPTTGIDPWGATSGPHETKEDPWGCGKSASSPVDNSDPFGDTSRPDNDPWGAPASASANDAWVSPNPPPVSSPSNDPFGDGASKGSDPWVVPSSIPSTGTGNGTMKEEELYKKTAWFLGSAGASLVDLDDLFPSNPKPQLPPINTAAAHTPAIGALNARGAVASGPVAQPILVPPSPALSGGHLGSILTPSFGAPCWAFGAGHSSETALFPPQSHFMDGCSVFQVVPQTRRVVQSMSVGLNPHIGFNMSAPSVRAQVVQSGSGFGISSAPPLVGAGVHQTGAAPSTVASVHFQPLSDSEMTKNTNPFVL